VFPSGIRAGTSVVVLLGDAVAVHPMRGSAVDREPASVTAPVTPDVPRRLPDHDLVAADRGRPAAGPVLDAAVVEVR
jgi:hypothetical protein